MLPTLHERYRLADRLLYGTVDGTIRNAPVLPHWIGDTGTFWCERWRDGTKEVVRVDPRAGTVEPYDPPAAAAEATRQARPDLTQLVNPQGTLAALVRDYDIWVRDLATEDERRLTTDGDADFGYGVDAQTTGSRLAAEKMGLPIQIRAAWSPDGTRLLTHRVDERNLATATVFDSSPAAGQLPTVQHYRYAVPGATQVPTYHLVILDADGSRRVDVDHQGLAATRMAFSPFATNCAWWGHVVDIERGEQTAIVYAIAADTGATRAVFTESSDSYLDIGWDVYGPIGAHYLPATNELLWMSERTGWMHLYIHDLTTGAATALTDGEFVVREILRVDEDTRTVVFTAAGREPGWDLYERAVYRVGFDGADLTLLTPDPADHDVLQVTHVIRLMFAMYKKAEVIDDVSAFSPDGRYFVASATRSGEAPTTSVFAVDGKKVLDLATVEADVDIAWPTRFVTTAADGTTPIGGQLFLPAQVEPDDALPVLDHVYLGPQTSVAAISNVTNAFGANFWTQSAALAQLGFAVTLIDGRGLPFRDKKFHDHSRGAIERTSDLDDHVAAIAQLRARHPNLADGPAGVIGHSGGGFGAARAILRQPHTYGVAVASAGNHDQRLFSFGWGERFVGLPVDDRWEAASNASLAADLAGKLLLIHGELDHGVHPAHTMQLVDALVKADRDFDMLLVPGADHGVSMVPHVLRRSFDYLVRHLAGAEPPAGVRIRGLLEVIAAL